MKGNNMKKMQKDPGMLEEYDFSKGVQGKYANERITYYRIRKGKYRAIFYIEDNSYFAISIAKREEVYDKWE